MFEGIFRKKYRTHDVKRHSLPVIDLGRGRDLGFQSYNEYRVKCGLKRANTFEQFTNIPAHLQVKLKYLYKEPDNVELYIGGLSEISVEGGVVGETFSCM